jgi:hypothetical protein
MGHGKFTKAYLPAAGDVTVIGPFNPDDDEVDFAKLVFLVVQGRAEDTVVVRGEGTWHRDPSRPPRERTEWRGTCKRFGDPRLGPSDKELQEEPGRRTRGIAVSIVVQLGRVEDGEFDPPSIESLNWCADLEIVGGNPPAPAPSTTT